MSAADPETVTHSKADHERVVVTRPGVLSADVNGEVVLLDASSGTYYGLNEVGARVWTLLGEKMSLGDVRDRLVQEFEVDPQTAWVDLIGLVGDLSGAALVGASPEAIGQD